MSRRGETEVRRPALSIPLAERRAFMARFTESDAAVRAAFFPDLPAPFDQPTDGHQGVADPALDGAIALAVDVGPPRSSRAHREPGLRNRVR